MCVYTRVPMCIQNAHGCVFLISITGGKYMLRTQDLNGIQLYTTCTHIFTFMCTPDHAPHLTFILQTKIHLVWIK